MLMAAKALLDRNPTPTRAEVVEAISGNICRCTGYEPIINAVLAAAARRPRTRLRGPTMLELRKDIFADERDDNLNEIGKGTQRQDMLGPCHRHARTYFDDHNLQGMLHLKVLRSPHAPCAHPPHRHRGGRARARACAASFAAPTCRVNLNTLLSLINFGKDDEPTLAVDKVRYKGEPIVAIVADSAARGL